MNHPEDPQNKSLDLFSNKPIENSQKPFIAVEDATQEIISLLLLGKTRQNIKEVFPYDEATINSFIDKAETEIASVAAVDVDVIIFSHVAVYEKLYNLATERGYTSGQLKSLRQKEDLLVLSQEVNEIKIINETETIVENKEDYDFSVLSDEEKKRLAHLLEKVK